jgi:inosose dehydratase
MGIMIGNSPESWGITGPSELNQTPWRRCLDEIADAGYQWLELGPYGYLPTDPLIIKRELSQRGLGISAGGILASLEDEDSWPDIEKEVLRTGELLSSLGAKFITVVDGFYRYETGKGLAPTVLDKHKWNILIDTSHKLGDLVKSKFGLQLAFHPCADTHVQYEEQILALLSETDPGLVTLCLDTGHYAYRFGDPASFMREHHERIGYLHLKSVDFEIRQQVNKDDVAFMDAVKLGVMCEPAQGVVDFTGFGKVLHEIGYDGYAIVEQDMYRPDLDVPFPIAKRTREYLRNVGIG